MFFQVIRKIEKGKDEEGLVKLSAFHEGNNVVIQIEDDGAGIDPDVIEQKAIDKGVASPSEIENMSDQEIINLIFAPGFSTNEEVSDVSGRGVGMDVVKRTIKSLDGDVYIKSEKEEGTKIVISLPLTLAIQDALMVKIDQEVFAIPLNAISETLIIKSDEII